MKTSLPSLNRRDFTKTALLAGTALASGVMTGLPADAPGKRIRTGVIGCGSVSGQYLPVLTQSPFVEVVSLCDIRYERAQKQGEKFKEFLELSDVTDVQYLRLKVIDRTGKVLDPCYYLLHFVNAPDCLDLEASGATRSGPHRHSDGDRWPADWLRSLSARECASGATSA